MSWTYWRKLADKKHYYLDDLNYSGPACYELAIYHPEKRRLKIVYVGETGNESTRMKRYGSDGSHLAQKIARHLSAGWILRYRACAHGSKQSAKRMQDNLLARFEYEWNVVSNR